MARTSTSKTSSETTQPSREESRRKIRTGFVTSNKMQKTIIVKVARFVRHPQYNRVIKRAASFKAHDETNSAAIGDLVRIMETRPLSKDKRWRLVEIVERASTAPPVLARKSLRNPIVPATRRRLHDPADATQPGGRMISVRSQLEVADNSGAKRVWAIGVIGRANKKKGVIGDVITAHVRVADPDAMAKKGEVVRCVIVRTRTPIRRQDGATPKFDSNAVVLIDNQNNPKGTRVFGPVARELREKRFMKIISLAPEVV